MASSPLQHNDWLCELLKRSHLDKDGEKGLDVGSHAGVLAFVFKNEFKARRDLFSCVFSEHPFSVGTQPDVQVRWLLFQNVISARFRSKYTDHSYKTLTSSERYNLWWSEFEKPDKNRRSLVVGLEGLEVLVKEEEVVEGLTGKEPGTKGEPETGMVGEADGTDGTAAVEAVRKG